MTENKIEIRVEKKQETKISFRHNGPIYNLTLGGKEIVVDKDSTGKCWMKLSFPPGGWGIWLLVQRPVSKVGALLVNSNSPAVIRCQIWDDEGFPMRGVIPFSVRIGNKVYWGAAEHGVGNLWIWKDIGKDNKLVVDVLGRTVQVKRMPSTVSSRLTALEGVYSKDGDAK